MARRKRNSSLKPLLVRVLAGIAVVLVLLHGAFFIAYGTIDPCAAAALRVINQQQSDLGRGIGIILSGPIETAIRSRGVGACYRIALTGDIGDVEVNVPPPRR